MARVETATLQQFFEDISLMFTSEETQNVVQSLKNIYGGKFNSLNKQDLLKCLQLLAKQEYVSTNKLKLVEDFIAPKSNQEGRIKEALKSFKASRLVKADPKKELMGRNDEIKHINKKLESKDTTVVNLFGSSGVGKTELAKEVCSKWPGISLIFDLREEKDMTAIYYNMLHSLDLAVPAGRVQRLQEYIVAKVQEKVKELKDGEHAVLFMLDNVDQFTAGKKEEGKKLKQAFLSFLEELLKSEEKRSPLKLLLTSRTKLGELKKMDDFEVKSLETSFSEKILIPEGMTDVKPHQKDNLIRFCKGFPLILKGLAAILRQERTSVDDLIARVTVSSKQPEGEGLVRESLLTFEQEGVDMGQLSVIREMFDTLPTESLKVSAVVISLFCGPFSVKSAAKVLGFDEVEAIALLEGLVASQITFIVDEEAKERKYDIHPLLQKYADSIKNHENFATSYLEAKERFYELFLSRLKKIAQLIEPDYVRAFHLFESDKANYEFTIDISLQPEYFNVPAEFHENALIASIFIAMLHEKLIPVFGSWAAKWHDDGKSGSLARAQLKSWEARQVADVVGTDKAFKVLREALFSVERVEDKSSDSFKLTKGLYLHTEGEILWRNRDYKKALASLELSLTLSEPLLKEHTDLARCYNAIGNCHLSLKQPLKALEFFEKAYNMQEKLANSNNHFDMPMYKHQIGAAYDHDGLKDYEKAVECYKDALRLLEELNLLGCLDEAHFCRDLANVLMFQKKYSEAVKPAERAFKIRMDLLKNHPLTVRSIFQRAVLEVNLEHPEEALKLFLEAWKMEKSLGAGNHSEVWRKIIEGVNAMSYRLKDKRGWERFRKDAFRFCQRFWGEQKVSGLFTFNEYNKEIIDALKEHAVDKKDKHAVHKHQLWFYEGMFSANEKEFQEKFDLETDNDALIDLLNGRERLLNEVIGLCSELHEREKLAKHKKDKVALYKMCLVKKGFRGNEGDGSDKTSLKSKVEQLYKETGQERMIIEFRETLLAVWQRQWDEGKTKEMTKIIGVEKEKTIDGILQLSKELRKVNLFKQYGQEALSFYDELWEVNHATMKNPEMKRFLLKVKKLASSIGDYSSAKLYEDTLQALNETDRQPGTILRPRATSSTSKSNKEEKNGDEEKEEMDIEHEKEEIEIGIDEESEVGAEDTEPTAEGVHIEGRSIIFKDTVTVRGGHWDVRKAAAHLVFPPGFVAVDTVLTLFRWKSSLCSPPLQPNEAIVSNVLELSADTPESLRFNKEVTLGISHSALDLKGYEVVVKTLINRERNEWEDVEQTVDYKSLSDLQKVYRDDFPDYFLPVAETKITRCSTFAVVCRLKSHIFTITSQPSTISFPDFPLVKIHIPPNSVPSTEEFRVTVRVQEYRCQEMKSEEMLAGPIVRMSCNKEMKFQEAVTVQLPLSLSDTEQDAESLGISDLSLVRARVLFQPSDGTQREWTEITDLLDSPPQLDGFVIKFNVKHFSGFWIWLASPVILIARAWNTESVRHSAVFTAAVPVNTKLNSEVDLLLYCSPNDKKRQNVDKTTSWLVEGSEWYGMCTNDLAYVFLSGDAVQVVKKERLKDFFLRFDREAYFLRPLPIRVVNRGYLTIEFYKSKDRSDENMIGILDLKLPPTLDFEDTPVEFFGVSIYDRTLHEAPLAVILAACKEVLEDIGRWDIYESHVGNNLYGFKEKCSFYGALARLPVEHQQQCFDAIVRFLREERQSGFEGFKHIEKHLTRAAKDVK